MTNEFILLTKIEFHDRYEGQILHVGTAEECEVIQDSMPAIFNKGAELIISAKSLIYEVAAGKFKTGTKLTETKH